MSRLAVEQLHLSLNVRGGLGRRVKVVLTALHDIALRVVFSVRGGSGGGSILTLLMNVAVLIVRQHDTARAGARAVLVVARIRGGEQLRLIGLRGGGGGVQSAACIAIAVRIEEVG